jgi:mono/diheme cytochrome c family protein
MHLHHLPGRALRITALSLLSLPLYPAGTRAQEATLFFKQNCTSCHTIGGGPLTGPDLKGVTQRRDRAWLVPFVLNPKGVIDAGDPVAAKLFQEARGAVMPTVFGITRERVESLLDLIEAESKLDRSQFAGVQISDRPFTADDVEQGREYFLGLRRLANGAPACVSCHHVDGTVGLGGGKLGPDLTKVYERLQGRKQLAAWLAAPATPTMAPVFKQHPLQPEEILALAAYFDQEARDGQEREDSVAALNFFLLGLGGTVAGLAVFDWVWRRRFRAVRRVLVDGVISGGHGYTQM